MNDVQTQDLWCNVNRFEWGNVNAAHGLKKL